MINLIIYRFSLLNKAKAQQVLNFYNEEDDLLDTMNDFCSHIHKNIRGYSDSLGKSRTFTLTDVQKKDMDKRIITGYFDSAYTGENGKIKDGKTNVLKFDISKNDLFSKDFFFLIHVPKNSKFGFLIVQKKENHGVKMVFENAFNNFMRLKGVSNYFLQLRQAPPRYFIKNFLEFGKLKEFRLIESSLKSSVDLINIDLGREERIFKLNSSLNDVQYLKDVLVKLFNSFSPTDEKIPFLNKGEFDEIAFVLGYGDASKTFYIKNQEKIRSNIDVTNLVEFEDGEATTDSLIKISLELINFAA
ncbi:hypothetical protein [Flavobacterium sp.]|uniref:hypothetical protein n=1 Tax=Flavobacterium sp. TaxID=239 RepID=UPI002B4B0203|nr:hypothetical protein [Flavobacterium sp.]HLF51040.1 hypothetical protein [Flavobacterium sp.]